MYIFVETFLRNANLSKRQSLCLYGGIVLVFLWGMFLRLYGLGDSSYWIDEGFTYAQAKAIASHGYPLLASGIVEWKDPLMPYLNAPLIFFGLEQNSWMMRLWSALFGIGSLIVGFLLARNLFGVRLASIYLFTLSTGYWFVVWSQQLRGYSALIFFALLVFYFLERSVARRSLRSMLLAFGAVLCAIAANKLGVLLFVPLISVALALKAYFFLGVITLPMVGLGIYFWGFVLHFFNQSLYSYNAFYAGHLFGSSWFLPVLILCGFLLSLWKSPRYALHLSVLYFALSVFITLSSFVKTGEKRYILIVFPFLFLYALYALHVGSIMMAKLIHRFIPKGNLRFVGFGFLVLFFCIFVSHERAHFIFMPQKEYLLEVYTPQPNFAGAYEVIKARGLDRNDSIVSPFPWMDDLYLGRSGYSIPWSLTGKDGDTALLDEYDYYTQAPVILPEKASQRDLTKAKLAIVALRTKGEVYVIIDLLSRRRMDQDLRHFIESDEDSELIFESQTGLDEIAVYVFSKL